MPPLSGTRRVPGAEKQNAQGLIEHRIISDRPNMVDSAAQLFRAISDPIRLRILHLLKSGELCVGDLVTVLGVAQPTASRHLISLRKIGLITSRKNSYWTFYALAPAQTELRRRVIECLDADAAGRAKDAKRLAAIRKRGGLGMTPLSHGTGDSRAGARRAGSRAARGRLALAVHRRLQSFPPSSIP